MKIKIDNQSIDINLENDPYGTRFWNQFSNNLYEPDTYWFIKNYVDEKTDFFDIGAANGAFTFMAAISSAKTYAFEPDPVMYKVLSNNVMLNSELCKNVKLFNAAVSDESTLMKFSVNNRSDILSPINFSNHEVDSPGISLEVTDLSYVLETLHDNTRKLVIKMDIEGAEFKILRNPKVIQNLKNHDAFMILAVHPGFSRPFRKRIIGLDKILHYLFQARNKRDSKMLYQSISVGCEVLRTNLVRINSSENFVRLVRAGYHEFILDFGQNLTREI